MTRFIAVAVLFAVCAFSWAEDSEEPVKSADETVLKALPKVPTLATIVGSGATKSTPIKWVQELLKKKETRARVEIVMLKQKLLADQEAQDVEERERIRRRQAYDKALGTLFDTGAAGNDAKKKVLTMKLDFQVPEMEMYRRLVEVYKQRAALAADVVESLTRLDRNNDGKLSGEEYRDAAYIFNSTQRLFANVDNDNDGYFTIAEVEAAKLMPASGAAAKAEGAKNAATTDTFMIKGFDANKDGVLNVEERKTLSSAYLELSIKATQEATSYQSLHDDLAAARNVAAAKFENLTIEMNEPR